jgi:hypothetical protein
MRTSTWLTHVCFLFLGWSALSVGAVRSADDGNDNACLSDLLPQLTDGIIAKMQTVPVKVDAVEPFLHVNGRGAFFAIKKSNGGDIYFVSAESLNKIDPKNGIRICGMKETAHFTEDVKVIEEMRLPATTRAVFFVRSESKSNVLVITEQNLMRGYVYVRTLVGRPSILIPWINFNCPQCGQSIAMEFDARICPSCQQAGGASDPAENAPGAGEIRSNVRRAPADEDKPRE